MHALVLVSLVVLSGYCEGRDIVLEATAQAQAIIEKWQNPSDCASKQFLVWNSRIGNGIGSDLHIESFVLARAMSLQRVLIYEPDSNLTAWMFTNTTYCYGSSNPDCFLRNLTHCPKPVESQIVRLTDSEMLGENTSPQFGRIDLQWEFSSIIPSSLAEVFAQASAFIPNPAGETDRIRLLRWIRSQFTRYRIQPNARMNNHIEGIRRSLSLQKDCAHPLFCVNVRHADKASEMKLHEFDEYMTPAENLRATNTYFSSFEKIHVLLSTEDNLVIEQAHAFHRNNSMWLFHYTAFGRGNENNYDAIAKYGAVEVALNSLTNLFLTDKCDAFFTTRGSNWGRLIDELRRTQGKENYPFIDLSIGDTTVDFSESQNV